MLSVIMLSVIMLSVIVLCVIMLNPIMLNVIMLNVDMSWRRIRDKSELVSTANKICLRLKKTEQKKLM
jgi:hypothetical protein